MDSKIDFLMNMLTESEVSATKNLEHLQIKLTENQKTAIIRYGKICFTHGAEVGTHMFLDQQKMIEDHYLGPMRHPFRTLWNKIKNIFNWKKLQKEV